jgi:hypothetical protein
MQHVRLLNSVFSLQRPRFNIRAVHLGFFIDIGRHFSETFLMYNLLKEGNTLSP